MKYVQTESGVQGLNDTDSVPNDLQDDGGPSSDTMIGIYNRTLTYFAKNAFRTILVAYRDMTMDEFNELKASNNDFSKPEDRDCLEKELVGVGIFGLQDPLRDEIKDSIKICNKAGITVIMCTGDNIETAKAISKNAGIVTDKEINKGSVKDGNFSCMTGE